MDKNIKRPATNEEYKNSTKRIRGCGKAKDGDWFVNGVKAMDKWGRLDINFVRTANHRHFAILRRMLILFKEPHHNFNRPVVDTATAKPFTGGKTKNAFQSLAAVGDVKTLARLIARTDILTEAEQEAVMKRAETHARIKAGKPRPPITIPTGGVSADAPASPADTPLVAQFSKDNPPYKPPLAKKPMLEGRWHKPWELFIRKHAGAIFLGAFVLSVAAIIAFIATANQ